MVGEVLKNRCINLSLVPPIMGEKRRIFYLVRTSSRETHDWTNVKIVNNELKSEKNHEKVITYFLL